MLNKNVYFQLKRKSQAGTQTMTGLTYINECFKHSEHSRCLEIRFVSICLAFFFSTEILVYVCVCVRHHHHHIIRKNQFAHWLLMRSKQEKKRFDCHKKQSN